MIPSSAGPSVRLRSWSVVVVGVAGAVLLWLGAGAPWWAPAVLVAGVVVGSLAGRAVAVVVTGAQAWGLAAGAAVALVWLAVQLSAGGRLLVAGLVLLVGALAVVPAGPTPAAGGPFWGGRAVRARQVRMVAGALAGLLLVAGLVVVGGERIRAAEAQAVADQQAGDFTRAQLLPQSPARAVNALLRAVAEDDPRGFCSAFTPAASAELAAAHGAVDCPGAIRRLHMQVSDPRRYASPDRDSVTETIAPDGQTGTADGCALHWTGLPSLLRGPDVDAGPPPGPQLGVISGSRQLGQGFLLTGYRPC